MKRPAIAGAPGAPYPRPAAVWFGVMGGMTAWVLHLGASYAVVPYVCGTGAEWLLHVLTAGLGAVGLAATMAAWRAHRRVRVGLRERNDEGRHFRESAGGAGPGAPGPAAHDAGSGRYPAARGAPTDRPAPGAERGSGWLEDPETALGRRYNFLAVAGVLMSGFFTTLIVVEGFPALLQADPCRVVPTLRQPIVVSGDLWLAAATWLTGMLARSGPGIPSTTPGGAGAHRRGGSIARRDGRRGEAACSRTCAPALPRRRRRPCPRGTPLVLAPAGALMLALTLPAFAFGHGGPPPSPNEAWSAWNWDLWLLGGLAAAAGLYLRGVLRLWRRAGAYRGIPRWRVVAYLSGLLALFVALISPVDALGVALFSVHMVQHLLLMVVAAPLLAMGRPVEAFLWSLPSGARSSIGQWWRRSHVCRVGWRVLTYPVTVLILHVGALWLWHVPRLYEAALASRAVHHLEHASFFFSALLFWWVLARAGGHARWPGYGAAVLYVFATTLQSGALGALITFAPLPWYAGHTPGVTLWGVDPLTDQQVAGILMWVPAGLVYALAGIILFLAWLRQAERVVRQRERLGWGAELRRTGPIVGVRTGGGGEGP